MKLKITALLGLLLYGSLTYSQKNTNYIEGQVILNDGSTQNVLIDRRKWDQTPEYINYKIYGSGQQPYRPTEIKGFKTDGLYYISVPLNDISLFDQRKEFGVNNRSLVFMQVIVEGQTTLLELIDSNLNKQYFVKNDSAMYHLNNATQKLQDSNGNYRVLRLERYKHVLGNLLNSCIDDKTLDRVQYQRKKLQEIVIASNECDGQITTYNLSKDKRFVKIGLTYSISSTSVKINSDDWWFSVNSKTAHSWNSSLGVYVDILSANQKWVISPTVFNHSYAGYFGYSDEKYIYRYLYDVKGFSSSFQISRYWYFDKISAFAFIEPTLTMVTTHETSVYARDPDFAANSISQREVILTRGPSIALGMGLSYSKYRFSISYRHMNSIYEKGVPRVVFFNFSRTFFE